MSTGRRGDLEEALRYQLETLTLDPKNVDIHKTSWRPSSSCGGTTTPTAKPPPSSAAPGTARVRAAAMIRILRPRHRGGPAVPADWMGAPRPDGRAAHLAYASFLAPAMAGDYQAAAAFMERDPRPG